MAARQRFRRLAMVLGMALWGPTITPAHAAVTCDDPAFADLLDMHARFSGPRDRSANMFFDAGAWHGYSLAPAGSAATGFVGPFLLAPENGRWAGDGFASVDLVDGASGKRVMLVARDRGGILCPGELKREAAGDGLTVTQALAFADDRRAVVSVTITSDRSRTLRIATEGLLAGATADGGSVRLALARGYRLVTRTTLPDTRAKVSDDRYSIAAARVLTVAPGRAVSFLIEQRLDPPNAAPLADADEQALAATRARWTRYLSVVRKRDQGPLADAANRRIAVKAIQTLIGNWRAPRGDLLHAGLFPSSSVDYFNGFWAWDSWKHAAALARFAPDLAKDQVRAMFDHQNAGGMVADAAYVDKAENNWRDTKPPLAGWAVAAIYRATGDKTFVREMFEPLLRYHRWWYAERDHDRDGLAEYGATDGTRIAAAWESGMDNAVRFDRAKLLRNGPTAWSLDQESVDLNAYLYREKLDLAELAAAIGRVEVADALRAEAATLRTRVRKTMFDPKSGYFFDTAIASGAPVRVYGPEGWTPLWAGLASPDEAKRVAAVMLDPKRFATYFPFPTLAADHPAFSPVKGYWRGPVWMDQAQFAVEALNRYGFSQEAATMRERLLRRARGLDGQGAFYENYDPRTGEGTQSRNFSWSAAHYLLMLLDG